MRPLVTIAWEWGCRCFGVEHMTNVPLRTLRLLEAVVELAQAHQLPKAKIHQLVDIVYARPVGDPYQELGGVLVTLNVLCVASGRNADDAFLYEILRCLAKSPEDFKKRNQEKLDLGLDA